MLFRSGDDYVKIHRVLSQISSINLIIESVAENKVDDLIGKLPEAYRDRVRIIERIVHNYIKEIDAEVQKYFKAAPKDNRKTFMIWVHENVPKKYKGYVRNQYLGLENNYIKHGSEKCPAYRKLNEMGVTDYKSIFRESETE